MAEAQKEASCPKPHSWIVVDQGPEPTSLNSQSSALFCPLSPLWTSKCLPIPIKQRKGTAANNIEYSLRAPFPTNKSRHVSRNCDSVEIGCGFSLTVKMNHVTWKELLPGARGAREFLGRSSPQETWEEEGVGLEAVHAVVVRGQQSHSWQIWNTWGIRAGQAQGLHLASVVFWRKPHLGALFSGTMPALRFLSFHLAFLF